MTTGNFISGAPRPTAGLVMALAGALLITPDTLLIRLSGLELGLTFWRGVLIGGGLCVLWMLFEGRRASQRRVCRETALIIVLPIWSMRWRSTSPPSKHRLPSSSLPRHCAADRGGSGISSSPRQHRTPDGDPVQQSGPDRNRERRRHPAGAVGQCVAWRLSGFLAAVGMPWSLRPPSPRCAGSSRHGIGVVVRPCRPCFRTARGVDWKPAAIILMGLVVMPLSGAFDACATAYGLTNVSLFMLLEMVLAPFWVWLGTGERPSLQWPAAPLCTFDADLLPLPQCARHRQHRA